RRSPLSSSHPRAHPRSTPFPYTTLFRSSDRQDRRETAYGSLLPAQEQLEETELLLVRYLLSSASVHHTHLHRDLGLCSRDRRGLVRKSTRLNSSHLAICYAVFCWKKKI